MKKPSVKWLSELDTFAVNRIPAHSDHTYYASMKEARENGPTRFREYLNGVWKFAYAPNPTNRVAHFYQTDVDCSNWDSIRVPGHIQLQGYGKPQYVNKMYPWDGIEDLQPPEVSETNNPVGSYVKQFTLPKHMEDKPLFISFQGVETAFYVWLNGDFIGYSEDSFTPADFELTPFVTKGENKLAVEVYQRSTGSWLEDQDFWRFSGIFRDVYLYSKPHIHVEDINVHTDVNDTFDNGTLNIHVALNEAVKGTRLALLLENADGKKMDTIDTEVTNQEEVLTLSVQNPHLWNAEDPYLYRAFIQVYDASGNMVEVIPQRIGFRTFEMKDGLMCINGERIVFKGVNRHEFNCYYGRTVSKEDMLWDIKTLKQNNINAVRTSHYPNETYWYALCDIYGIYVIDEMNLETHGTWEKIGFNDSETVIPGNDFKWQDIIMDRATSMYERDKNHPSIVIWSIGNESFGGEVLYHVSNYFREVDSSRLVHYEGVFHDRSFNDTSDMESRMYATPDEVEIYLSNQPEKPYIVCEYMHAMGTSLGGMKEYTDLEDTYAQYQGGFIWDFMDQGLVKKDIYGEEYIAYGGDFDDRPSDYNFCLNGIVYADRTLTPKMPEVRYLYQDITLTPDNNGVLIHNKRLFTDTSDVILKYTLRHEGKDVFHGEKYVQIPAKKKQYVELDIPDELSEEGEYVIHTALVLAEDTKWAEAGHEVAFGEFVFYAWESTPVISDGPLSLVEGDYNIGVHGRYFQALFSKQEGTLVSLVYNGKEMINQPPKPLFWRAVTDNDKGVAYGFTNSAWFAASLAPMCTSITCEKQDHSVIISTEFALSIDKDVQVSVQYTIDADGKINVQSVYEGVEGLPNMPVHAIAFKLPAVYDQLDWYAKGPHENYSDRKNGAKLCHFKNVARDNVSIHGVPQESGGRTGVRRVDITNQRGEGLRISSVETPVECTVAPYSAFELENATHHYELPPVHYTVVTVAGERTGVGGIDSWGTPVNASHQVNADGKLEFEFMIEPV